MRRIVLFVVFLFIFLSISHSLTSSAYAQSNCPVTLTPSNVNSEYNDSINIAIDASSGCVFQSPVEYTIFFCPSSDLDDVGKSRCNRDDATPRDSKNLMAKLNVFAGDLGDKFPGLWYVTVCTGKTLPDCKNTVIAVGLINVGVDPTVTPPFDLPKIDSLAQARCKFQAGESVTLTATNIVDGREYQWWWNGGIKTHDIGTANNNTLTFVIPGRETREVGIRNACVEDKNGSRTTGQFQHCITLEFFPGTPTGDTSCQAINSDPEYFEKNNNSSFPVPPPPCATLTPDGKCISVNTAIGIISTEPEAFVRSIFGIVLGLAGGISLLLIIISGYRMMASQGNPESITNARQQLVAAIVGLLFIIFSFVILQVIGVDILKIPGFTP